MNDDTVRALTKVLRDAGHQAPSDFLRVLAELFAAFEARNGGVSPMRLTVYVQDLADIELSALSRACAELRRESKFLPTIAEVRERVASWSMDAAGVNFSPEQAWDEVMRLVQCCGTNRVPGVATDHGPAITFRDPVTCAIMTAHWWRSIGHAPTETLMSERRVFIDSYKANATRARRELQCGRALAAPRATRELGGGSHDRR